MQGRHLFTVVSLYYCATTCSPLASVSQQGAVSGDVALEGFCWHTQALVLLRLLLSHTEVSRIFALAEWMRYNISLGHFHYFFKRCRLLLPFSENLWNLSSDFVTFWAVAEPVLFCAFLFLASLTLTDIRPINIE